MKDPPKLIGMLLIAVFAVLTIAGCGTYSQARVDDLEAAKRNHVQDVERAQEGKLTAVELRSSLASIDNAILAEHAHKGDEAALEALKAKLEKQSDEHVAKLFNGDNGRSDPNTAESKPPEDTSTGALDAGG